MGKRRALNKPAMARRDPSNDHDNSDGNFEKRVTELLEEPFCSDLIQVMIDSLLQVARHSTLSIHEKAAEWRKQWMTQYGEQLPVSLDQAFELCNLASTKSSESEKTMLNRGDRKVGEDIRMSLPIPSGCFGEDMCETMVPIPLPTTAAVMGSSSSWYPPLATCEDPMSEEDENAGEYADDAYDSEDSDDDGPINM
ncbi:hypothetical protein BDB00DRAFT_474561 [Zychaea mexicana]|uniref:uncharacterized protein n=1 Tax=Zychaea mexicana TaxID=64656 RepID=UPI0022FED53A|nr:uncharacterized protein BDB00DRAFT_474561 [Zychaea mexicana]KAI9491652.1 hypothetical protein BDB00DRAFT_474561 [Zychaea mexicana]